MKQYNVPLIDGIFKSNMIVLDLYKQGAFQEREGYDPEELLYISKLIGCKENEIIDKYPFYTKLENVDEFEIIDIINTLDADGYIDKMYFKGIKLIKDKTKDFNWSKYLELDVVPLADKLQFLQLQGVSLDQYFKYVNDIEHEHVVLDHYYNQDKKEIIIKDKVVDIEL